MYSTGKPDPTRVTLAKAISAAHFGDYSKAMALALPLGIEPDSPLCVEWNMVLYLASRGTGDADAAEKHLQEFVKATRHSDNCMRRAYMAKEVAVHFSDADTAAFLIQDLPEKEIAGSQTVANLPFMLKVLRGEAPLYEQLNFLWRATALNPDEDWMASYIINHTSDPTTVERVIELLDSIRQKCHAGYEDAIEHRKAHAQRKLAAM